MKNQVFSTKPLADGPALRFECRLDASLRKGSGREESTSYDLSTKTFAPELDFK